MQWISQTILERIVEAIQTINQSFQNHYMYDMTVGTVGLEKLRKISQTEQVQQYCPTLSTLIPFLEITTNQEYLVHRFNILIKGGCMSEFKWNGGGSFKGKDWDDSLPADSVVSFCFFIVYFLFTLKSGSE